MRLRNLFSDEKNDHCTLGKKYVVPEGAVNSTFFKVPKRGQKILNEFLKPRLWNRRNTTSDTVTKNGVQFRCVKSAQCSKRHDKLLSARNKAALFSLAYLSPVRQGKDIWNTFLAMKPSLSSLFIRTWESRTNRKKVKHY